MIVTVVYGKIVDMDRARACARCEGKGRDRYHRGRKCPRCRGTGVHPEGWAYLTPADLGEPLALGDVVECPPTPYSKGRPVLATVVDREVEHPGRRLKTIIRRVGAEWPAEATR